MEKNEENYKIIRADKIVDNDFSKFYNSTIYTLDVDFNFVNRYDSKLIFINKKKNRFNNKIFKKKGFKFVNLESYSFINQIKLFNSAKIIAGVHGAGFANIIFCKKNTSIIEFKTRASGNIIKNVAIKNKLKYRGFISRSSSITNNQNGELDIDIDRLKNII